MQSKKSLAVLVLAIVSSSPLASTAPAAVLDFSNGLYNTGYNGNTLEATDSQIEDTHYVLVGVPSGQSEVPPTDTVTYTGQVYSGSPTSTTATEITPLPTYPGSVNTEYPKGDYTYQLNLYSSATTTITPGDIITITGTVVGDDAVPKIDGNADGTLTELTGDGPTGAITSDYTNEETFTLTFTAGTKNSVDFTVFNSHGYSGLLVDNLKGTITPEPATWALLLSGAGMLCFIVLRRNRSLGM
jgi:hypothetical protein